jgi:hypothetical protein
MVKVLIDGREVVLVGRLADVVRRIVEHSARIAEGSKVLRIALRGTKVTLSVEEEL